jgi:hypothetical protein
MILIPASDLSAVKRSIAFMLTLCHDYDAERNGLIELLQSAAELLANPSVK